jgi:hypothetical protein
MEEVSSELRDPLPELSELLVDFFQYFSCLGRGGRQQLKN